MQRQCLPAVLLARMVALGALPQLASPQAIYWPPPPPPPIPDIEEYVLPPPPPPPPSDASLDAELSSYSLAMVDHVNATGRSEELKASFTTSAERPRSSATTSWLDRDRKHVTGQKKLSDDDTQLHEGREKFVLAGNLSEKEAVMHLTRHGLYRRPDAKFAEFVAQPTGDGEDGYGLWRTWESHGPCPHELLIADPWGSITFQAHSGHIRERECSWVVRPGMYLQDGYFRLSRAPITLSFRSLSLSASHETLNIYDGAQMGAPLLARLTGPRRPDQITSTSAEVRIVLSATLRLNATAVWSDMARSLSAGNLREAQARFIQAARSRLVGFYRQPMQRILRAMAIRATREAGGERIRRAWFANGEEGFLRVYNDSLVSVLEDLTAWEKRSRDQEGKEHMPWDHVLGVRRYPVPVFEPDLNPFHPKVEESTGLARHVDAELSVQLDRYLGFREEYPSAFSLDFTTSADCAGRGIAPYGEGVFPPLTMSADPGRNFEYLPFPLDTPSCQPLLISGPQTTRDRPYTVADAVMKTAQETQLYQCLGPGQCDLQYPPVGAAENCSAPCAVFMQCVQEQMGNRSAWKVGPNLYNKSHVAAGRNKCLVLPEAQECINVQYSTQSEGGWWLNGWTREAPKNAICLAFPCATCAVDSYVKYFKCGLLCGQDRDNPHPECIDCSYSFQDSYEDIDALRERLWEAYLSGMFGFHICPDCNLEEDGMMGGAEIGMSRECRRCHYAIEDVLNSDVFACLNDGNSVAGGRCLTLDRRGYNFEQDFFGVIPPNLAMGQPGGLDLTLLGNAEELLEEQGAYGYGPG